MRCQPLLPATLLLIFPYAARSCCSFFLAGTASKTPGYAVCSAPTGQAYTTDSAAALDLSGGLSFSCAPPSTVFPLGAAPRTLSLWVNCGGGQAPNSGFLSFAGYANAAGGRRHRGRPCGRSRAAKASSGCSAPVSL